MLHKQLFAAYPRTASPYAQAHDFGRVGKFMNVPVASKRCVIHGICSYSRHSQAYHTRICVIYQKKISIKVGTAASGSTSTGGEKTGIRCNIPLLDIPL